MTVATTNDNEPAKPVTGRVQAGITRAVGGSGIVAVAVFVAGHLAHGEIPVANASTADVSAYYRTHHASVSLAAALIGAGALFFLAFAAAVRTRLRSADDSALTEWGFGGGVAFATGLIVSAAFLAALGGSATHISANAIEALHALISYGFPLAGIGAASFLIPNGLAVIRSRALPVGLGWAAIPVGALGLVPEPTGDIAILGLALWTSIVSVLLVRRGAAA
jgi:hypothetical protein